MRAIFKQASELFKYLMTMFLCNYCYYWLGRCLALYISVQSTARHAIHLQFDNSPNALEIRVIQSLKCIV
jgi:hypothetical protein